MRRDKFKDEGRRMKAEGLFSSFILHPSSLHIGTLPLFFLALILLTLYARANWLPKPAPKPDSTWVRITQEGVFRIGIDPSFPPFEADDGKGNLSGLDIALVNEMTRVWSEETGTPIRIEYVYTGYDGLYDALKNGQFDAILSALPYDPRKTQDALYTRSYFNSGPFIVVREPDASVKSWFDVAGKRIGVELGSSGDAFARRWQRRMRYEVREFGTPTEALRALRSGQVDAAFVDIIAYHDFVKRASGLRIAGDPLSNELIVLAVRRETPTLWAQINAVIDAMKRDGRMEKLYAEWF